MMRVRLIFSDQRRLHLHSSPIYVSDLSFLRIEMLVIVLKSDGLNWRQASDVLCDCMVTLKLKDKFYRTAIQPTMLYEACITSFEIVELVV
jgi:hypothetical protein